MFRNVRFRAIADSIMMWGFWSGYLGFFAGFLGADWSIGFPFAAFLVLFCLGAVLGFWVGLTREICRMVSEASP